jgi:hypothetical protein
MTLKRLIAICAALAVLALPAVSLADHHKADEEAAEHRSEKAGEKAGGEAAEHRSDMAAEKSNAQWDEGNEGRPEKSRAAEDGDGDADENADEGKEKKDKEEKKDKGQKSDD